MNYLMFKSYGFIANLHSRGVVMGSPVLLHNLSPSSNGRPKGRISLRASPFGSRQPAIPTARAVTVARVASPISTDRTYQLLFLHSLKNYFGVKKRLVKKGDLIAIGVDTDSVCRVVEIDPNSDDFRDLDITAEK
jgi:peroxin-6